LGNWNIIQQVCIIALPVIFAITMHQAAMAYAAKFLGDTTAEESGMLSLNPGVYIDPLGTLLLPLLAVVLHVPLFGWAKWAPIDYGRMRNPKSGLGWVAVAGVASNVLMALIWGLLFKLATSLSGGLAEPLAYMAVAGIQINIVLMLVSLIPVPPQDGGRILLAVLPHRQAATLARIAPYGNLIIIALLMTGLLARIIGPMVSVILYFFVQIL
jgi:Zn-dependent protease